MGGCLPKPILSKVVGRAGAENIRAAACSVNGYRTNMEDAHAMYTYNDRIIIGVFDGHCGDKCSNYIAEHLPRKLNQLPFPLAPKDVEEICLDLDGQFIEDVKDGGSTATFCVMNREPEEEQEGDGGVKRAKTYRLLIGNVGDSRTLIIRDGTILMCTVDHKPDHPDERRRIEECGGEVRSGRIDGDLAVSRAFGDMSFKRKADVGLDRQKVVAVPDILVRFVQEGDILVLGCDGLFEGSLTNGAVASLVTDNMAQCNGDVAVVAARLCDEAIRKGSKDNVSCIVAVIADGREYVEKYGATEFLPGPPFARAHEASRTVYAFMASMAQLSLADALQMRYKLLKAYDGGTLHTGAFSPIQRLAFEMGDEVEREIERAFFGSGPAPGNEAAFFESLAAERSGR